MTNPTMESLEVSGFEGMIKEGPEAFDGYPGPLPCFVHHRYAGGRCKQPGAMQVYGISFCEVHGAEAQAGALAEIYHDAGNTLMDLYDPEGSAANAAALAHLSAGIDEATHRCVYWEDEQAAALRSAYPLVPERVDTETREHDYWDPDPGNDDPADVFMDARMHVHRLMRLSWSAGQHWILEILEEEREGASAQLAFALELRAQKLDQPH